MSIDERKVQLGVEVDASRARQGFDEVKTSARDMAQAVAQAGQQAGKGVDAVGAGGAEASQKLDRSTKSIVASIQRATAAMEAGERGTAKYFETLAQQRGANVDALKPYLAQLDEAIKKQHAAASSIGQMGTSARATAFAMRGLPAQFTDIVTALASGQRPLTVMLQQGGQLKDMFGSVGGAARGVGTYLSGLLSPLNLAVAAAGALGYAFYQGTEESKNLAKALILTGNAANTSVSKLQDLAASVSVATGATRGAAAGALEQLVSTGQVTEQVLSAAAEGALRMERVAGRAIADTVKEFAELGRAPVDASLKLNEQYNYLTASIFKQIKALEDQGRTAEAATLAQRAYADSINDGAKKIEDNLGLLERAWLGIKDGAKGAWDAMLGLGREDSVSEKIRKLKAEIATAGGVDETGTFRGANTDRQQKELAAYEAKAAAERKSTEEKARQNKQEQARVAWLKEEDKYLSKREQMEREITRIRNQGAAAGVAELEIQKRIEHVREKYTDKRSGKAANDVSQRYAADLAAEKDFTRAQVSLIQERVRQRLLTEEEGIEQTLAVQEQGYLKQVQLLQAQIGKTADAGEIDKLRQQIRAAGFDMETAVAKARTARVKLADEALKAEQDYMRGVGDETAALLTKAKAAEEENARIGLTADQLSNLTARRYDEQIAQKEAYAATLRGIEGREAELYLVEQQIQALNRLRSAEISKPKLQEQAKAWEDFTRDIESSLTDALMRGFERGESFGGNLVKTLRHLFATTVLKMTVQAIVKPVMNEMQSWGQSSGVASWFGSLFSGGGSSSASYAGSAFDTEFFAKGGVKSAPGLSAYSGSIVDRPTVFPFAKGIGLMGEAGPEAILPLRRGNDGRLGVTVAGGGGQQVGPISITVNAEGGDREEQGSGAGLELARRMEAAVRQVLLAELRPGGLLGAQA